MSWEYDFVALAVKLFEFFVLGLLPTTAVIVFLVYFKRIITVWVETRKMRREVKARKPKAKRTARQKG